MGKLQQQVGALNESDRLRERIEACEKAQPYLNRSDVAAQFLRDASEAHRLLDALEAGGTDIRPELSRLNTVAERAIRSAKTIVKAVGGTTAYVRLRAEVDPGSIDPWWTLDRVVAESRRRLLIGAGSVVALIVALLVSGYAFRDVLFPPNPVGDAVTAATKSIAGKDVPQALAEIQAGLAITPTNGELLLWQGALLEAQGDPAAQKSFDAVRAKAKSQDFLINRGNVYLRMGDSDRALADLNEAIKLDPQQPIGYFLRATVHEFKGEISKAIDDLEETSRLAEAQRNDQLFAVARVRLGTLLQQAPR